MPKKPGKKRAPLQVDEPSDDEFYESTNDQEEGELMAETMDTPPKHRESSLYDQIQQSRKNAPSRESSVESRTKSCEDESEDMAAAINLMNTRVKIDKETHQMINHLNGDILKGVMLNNINHLASWKYDLINAASINAHLKTYLYAALMEPENLIRALGQKMLTEKQLTECQYVGTFIVNKCISLSIHHQMNEQRTGIRNYRKKLYKEQGYETPIDWHTTKIMEGLDFLYHNGKPLSKKLELQSLLLSVKIAALEDPKALQTWKDWYQTYKALIKMSPNDEWKDSRVVIRMIKDQLLPINQFPLVWFRFAEFCKSEDLSTRDEDFEIYQFDKFVCDSILGKGYATSASGPPRVNAVNAPRTQATGTSPCSECQASTRDGKFPYNPKLHKTDCPVRAKFQKPPCTECKRADFYGNFPRRASDHADDCAIGRGIRREWLEKKNGKTIKIDGKIRAVAAPGPRTDLPPLGSNLHRLFEKEIPANEILHTSNVETVAHDQIGGNKQLLERLSELAVIVDTGCQMMSVVKSDSRFLTQFKQKPHTRGTAGSESAIEMSGEGVFTGCVLSTTGEWVKLNHPTSVANEGNLEQDLISTSYFVGKGGGLNQHAEAGKEKHLFYVNDKTATRTLYVGAMNYALVARNDKDRGDIQRIFELVDSISEGDFIHQIIGSSNSHIQALSSAKTTLDVWSKRLGLSLEKTKAQLSGHPELIKKDILLGPSVPLTEEMIYHANEEAVNVHYQAPEIMIDIGDEKAPLSETNVVAMLDAPFRRMADQSTELVNQRFVEIQHASEARRIGTSRKRHFEVECASGNNNLSTIAVDSFGPVSDQISRLLPAKYVFLATDTYSGATFIHLGAALTESERGLKVFYALTRAYGYQWSKVRSDNGRENLWLKNWTIEKGMLWQPIAPYTPEQNGFAERRIGQIIGLARTFLLQSGLPTDFWPFAVIWSTFVWNRRIFYRTGKPPLEVLTGKTPVLKHLRIFGCVAYCLTNRLLRENKFACRVRKVIFVGRRTGAWIGYDPLSTKTIAAQDFAFDESISGKNYLAELVARRRIPAEVLTPTNLDLLLLYEATIQNEEEQKALAITEKENALKDNQDCESLPKVDEAMDGNEETMPVGENLLEEPSELTERELPSLFFLRDEPTIEPILRGEPTIYRLRDKAKPVEVTPAYTVPKNYSNIKQMDKCDQEPWLKAMQKEINNLESRNVFEWVSYSEASKSGKIVPTNWVFAWKQDENGHPKDMGQKGRIVVVGSQMDPTNLPTYAAVTDITTLRILISVSALYQRHIYSADFTAAFLYAELSEEEIFHAYPPQGTGKTMANGEKGVWRVKRALYGTSRSPRLWRQHITSYLASIGFEEAISDPGLFFTKDRELILILHVDDLLISGTSEEGIIRFLDRLKHDNYNITIEKYPKKHLGLNLSFEAGKWIKVTQEGYVMKTLTKLGFANCVETRTPLKPRQDRLESYREGDQEASDKTYYQQLLGTISWMTLTRPDLLTARSILSEFLQKPTAVHVEAAEHVMRYIWTTKDNGLIYYHHGDTKIVTYTDADFGAGADKTSRVGYLCLFGSGYILGESKRLKRVFAESVAESEFIAKWYGHKQSRFVRNVIQELGLDEHVIHLRGDNLANEKILNGNYTRNKLRGLAIIFQSLIHNISEGSAVTSHIEGKMNPADLMTKADTRRTVDDINGLRSIFMWIPEYEMKTLERIYLEYNSIIGASATEQGEYLSENQKKLFVPSTAPDSSNVASTDRNREMPLSLTERVTVGS